MRRNIFIASSAELRTERLELVDLLLDLNNDTKNVGIQFKPVVWEFMDSSMQEGRKEDEYLVRLKECEICLVLFWKTLGEYTVEELDVAGKEMYAGRLPKKVLVLFKEPSDGISPELLAFKDSYSKKYTDIPSRIFTDMKSLKDIVSRFILAS